MRIALLEASHWHVPLYLDALDRADVQVVAVSDREALKGPAVAGRFGCAFHRSYADLLRDTAVDFAFVFGRHVDMPAIGHALIDRGIPFAIEKPCGTKAADVAALRARAEAADLYVAVPFIQRVGEPLQAIIAAEGALPTRLNHYSFRFIGAPPSRYVAAGCPWMLDRVQAGGGCTINVGTHYVDLFRLLNGAEVKTVSAAMSAHGGDVEDHSVVVMTAANGRIGVVETGYTFPGGQVEQRELSFSISSEANFFRSLPGGMLLSRRAEPEECRTTTMSLALDPDPMYGRFVDRVLADVCAGRTPVAGLADAHAVMRVLDAAYASARAGGDEALRLEPNLVPALILRAALINNENEVDPNAERDRIAREQDRNTAKAVQLDPTDPAAWAWRAAALASLGRWNAALEASATAIKLDPYESKWYLIRADHMIRTARPTEALALVDRALALRPDNAMATAAACEAHVWAGQTERAIATCEKASGLFNHWSIYLALAAAYANHGELAKATAARTEALRTVPGLTIAQLRTKRGSDNPEYLDLAEKNWDEGLRKAGVPEK